MSYCLDSTELEKLLDLRLNQEDIEDAVLNSRIENADQWQEKVLCLTFSLARILFYHFHNLVCVAFVLRDKDDFGTHRYSNSYS